MVQLGITRNHPGISIGISIEISSRYGGLPFAQSHPQQGPTAGSLSGFGSKPTVQPGDLRLGVVGDAIEIVQQ